MVSVIVCTHHAGELFYYSIDSLMKQKGVEFEIIVVSTVPVDEKRLDKRIRVLRYPGGPAGKRNFGVKAANGELIAFYDDDIQADTESLLHMQKAFGDKSVGMVFGKLKNMEFRDRFDEAGGFLTWTGFIWSRAESGIVDHGQYEKAEPIFAGKSAACMIRKKLFRKVGGFHEDYEILGEESDLAWRIWISGNQVFYVPQSVTYHAFNTKFKPRNYYTPERVYFNGCRNYITMLASNLPSKLLWRVIPVHVACWIAAMLGMFVTLKFRQGWEIGRAIVYVFTHWNDILAKRLFAKRIGDIEKPCKHIFRSPSLKYYFLRFVRYFHTGLHG